jgi:hypothetical protein
MDLLRVVPLASGNTLSALLTSTPQLALMYRKAEITQASDWR